MNLSEKTGVLGVLKTQLLKVGLALAFVGIFVTLLLFALDTMANLAVIRPNGDGTTLAGTPTGCGAGGDYDCLDEIITAPTAPSTGSDYMTWVNTDSTFYLMETIADINTVSSITVQYYHIEGGTNAQQTVGLFAANETTQYGTTQNVATSTSAQWDTVTFSGLSLTQTQLDSLKINIQCTKTGGGTANTCTGYALYGDVTYTPLVEVDVGTSGAQQNLDVGTTSANIGGTFVITELVSSRNITSISINETGTVDALNNLDNIELYYDLDITAPYDCVSESFSGTTTESQFGVTDTSGFDAVNGTSTFTGTVGISTTTTMCVYTVLDVATTSSATETIEIQISEPSVNVIASGVNVDVQPAIAVLLSGTTVLQSSELNQIHYHFRNDDGSEADPGGATSATGGVSDTTYDTLGKLTPIRLRLEVSNEGNKTSSVTKYRLEYAQKVTTCGTATGWTDVGAALGDWDMYDSANLTDGNDTTDIASGIGGVLNENTTFLTPNGGIKDTSSQTGNITLTSSEFVELEYSILATSASTEGYTYCFRLTDAGTALRNYNVYPEATVLADITVSSNGTQVPTIDIPTSNVYIGADFKIVDNIAGDTTITSITISASGTVDYQNDINNIQLLYDLDTTAPYDCASESYSGIESQFGSTDTNGFDASGTSTFTGSRIINPTQALCLYVEFDVGSGATNNETLDIKIDNASTDVVISTGTVAPASLVSLSSTTKMVIDNATQIHYQWRNDDGTESGATSATGGIEDTVLQNLKSGVPKRLRIEVSNEGSSTTPSYQYRLEYAVKTSVCSTATGWTDVGATADAFDMFNSTNITDGNNTTNIAGSIGGVTDEEPTFLTPNAGVKDTSSQVASVALLGDEFIELEYSIVASTTATEGATYCFRVTDAGTPIKNYSSYPETDIRTATDFYIQRGVSTISGTSLTLTAGTDYVAPAGSTTAFMRITNTLNTGAGGGATGNSNDVTVYISDPSNIPTSVTLTRPAGATGNTRVAWEIIEYIGVVGGSNEIVVRQQSIATYGTALTSATTSASVGIFDDNDVVVFITGQFNPDTATNYPYGNSTAMWNATGDTATFTRGATGNASGVSYSVVEFIGSNWLVQRSEHTYTSVGTTETEAITAVNSLSRVFIHTQKRMATGLNTHGDFGHQVWMSGVGQVSYVLDSTAGTPGSHTSVAWIVENIQTIGTSMVVTRSNGTQSGGASPTTLNVNIGKTISDTQDASIFMNNSGDEPGGGGGLNSFPEPMMSARIISNTQYELWIADTSDSRSWRTEIVEWPTATRKIAQNYYRFYVDNDALDPTDPWPVGAVDLGENTEVTGLDKPIASGGFMRLRMTLAVSSATMAPGLDSFKLQYGERNTVCTAILESAWRNIGNVGSTTALWRGFNGTPVDGTNLSTDPPAVGALNISVSDVAGTYEENNDSALTPFEVIPSEDVEFDWAIENNNSPKKTDYCFRMIETGGTLFNAYNFYPVMRTAGYGPESLEWRWYDDAENETPSVSLAAEEIAPIDIAFNNTIQLRYLLSEINGATENATKFVVQFSEYSDFSTSTDVTEIGDCGTGSLWCYGNGAGIDNATITTALLTNSDSCVAGVGNGCGSYNESGTSTSEFTHKAGATTEFAFNIRNAGARPNRVYYFRLYDVTNNELIPLGAGKSYPSLVSEGASLVFEITGINSGIVTEGITTDVASTPTGVAFGTIPIDIETESAQKLTVSTNATEGYQILMFSSGDLLNVSGDKIDSITSDNTSPISWSISCDPAAYGCFGYHAGDDTLEGGSTRFSAVDTYARVSSTTPEEVVYSSVPISNESTDIVFKTQIGALQSSGNYETRITYIAIPIF